MRIYLLVVTSTVLLADFSSIAEPPEEHWSYRAVVRPSIPRVSSAEWTQNPIDRFVLSRLETEGIQPSPQADRRTLIRRLFYDLVGLAPDPDQVRYWMEDKSPDWYVRLVNQLTASPRFGERWGRHWLDKARYADSDGYEKDNVRPDAWRYRDWVIRAFNMDMPFDQFTAEQMAGDLLPEPTDAQILATAFHRQTLTNTEGGTDKEEFRVEAIFDRVATAGTIWLGLTVGCAQCHDHKYDQISQREFYQLFSFFDNGDETTRAIKGTPGQIAKFEVQQAAYEDRQSVILGDITRLRSELTQAGSVLEKQLQDRIALESNQPVQFHELAVRSSSATGKAVLARQEDGTVLVSGENPDKVDYVIELVSPQTPSNGIRLETIPLVSLGGKGAGRAPNGNFVINQIRLKVEGQEKPLVWTELSSDYSQNGFSPSAVSNADKKSGWAVGGQIDKPHWIQLQSSAIIPPGTNLKLSLIQQYGGQHTLGSFRVRGMSGITPDPLLTSELRAIAGIKAAARSEQEQAALVKYALSRDPKLIQLAKVLADHKKKAPKRPEMKVRVIAERTKDRRATHVMVRGNFQEKGELVEPGTLGTLVSIKARNGGIPDRLDFASWLTGRDNPLTPRVTVNEIWRHLFGEGLVRTNSDFGIRGEVPSHPDLLDWLAAELIEQEWSQKSLIKLIVTSKTYMQSSRHRPEFSQRDPKNVLLHRQNRLRVEAEIVRDLHLSASGLIANTIGGPSVFPPLPPGIAELSYASNFKWATSGGSDKYRRGMYTFFKRTAPHPNLTAFDCPESTRTCVKRNDSNTPLQALTLLNNTVFVESARVLGKRAYDSGTDRNGRLSGIYKFALGRTPDAVEVADMSSFWQTSAKYYQAHPEAARALCKGVASNGQDEVELATAITVARIVLNLDEFITRE